MIFKTIVLENRKRKINRYKNYSSKKIVEKQ